MTIITPTSECCLISAQHSTKFCPETMNFSTLYSSTTICNWTTDRRQFRLTVAPPPVLFWTLEPPRAVCSAPSCLHCALYKHQENGKFVGYSNIIIRMRKQPWEEIYSIVGLCTETTLPLKVSKTKKLTVTPFCFSGGEVDRMNSFRFPENLSQLMSSGCVLA